MIKGWLLSGLFLVLCGCAAARVATSPDYDAVRGRADAAVGAIDKENVPGK